MNCHRIIAWALTFMLLVPASSWAVDYDVKFCWKYATDFSDASTSVGDDKFVNNNNRVARGALVTVYRSGWHIPLYAGFTPDAGANAGCTTTLTISSSTTYTVTIYSSAEVGDNNIAIHSSMSSETPYSYWVTGSVSADGTINLVTPTAAQWNVAAATGYAMWRRDGGLTNEEFEFNLEACPDSEDGGSCLCTDPDEGREACIDPNDAAPGANDKYVIAHEMGHLVERFMCDCVPTKDYGASDGSTACPDKGINAYEYQSAAFHEGFAHFYAALVWNDTTESDCHYRHYQSVNWDNSGGNDYQPAFDWYIDCEAGSHDGFTTVAGDYYDDQCDGASENDNRATIFDWLRMLWDLSTDQNLSLEQISDIIDFADPEAWNANGNGTGGNYPANRLYNGAVWTFVLTEWNAEDNYNGVHR